MTTAIHRFRTMVLASALLALGFSSTAFAASFALPGGSLQVSSIGVAELEPESDSSISALHVRLIASNLSDGAGWGIDTRNVIATVAGEGSSRPAFANVDAGTLPRVTIGYGQTRTIDLYYPLASDLQPAFTVSFQLQTGSGLIANRAAFAADLPLAQVATGYGAVWWYDASYPRYGFRNRPSFRAAPVRRMVVRPSARRPVPAPVHGERFKNQGQPSSGYRAPAAPQPAPAYHASKPAPAYHAPAAPAAVRVRAPATPAYRAPAAPPTRVAVRAPAAPSSASSQNGRGQNGHAGNGGQGNHGQSNGGQSNGGQGGHGKRR